MTISKRLLQATASAAVLAFMTGAAIAEDYTITVWAGGSGDNANYRVDAIEMAADFLTREAAVRGEDLTITVEKQMWSGWDDFKQAVTLAAESGTAPNIIVSGHEDIGPWSQAGILRPIEDYVDLDVMAAQRYLYPNLVSVSSYRRAMIWGHPAGLRVPPLLHVEKAHLAEIGYSDEPISRPCPARSIPARIHAL